MTLHIASFMLKDTFVILFAIIKFTKNAYTFVGFCNVSANIFKQLQHWLYDKYSNKFEKLILQPITNVHLFQVSVVRWQ